MNHPPRLSWRPWALPAAILVALTVTSCGGGVVGSGGTGNASGQTSGTVNGFGSVIVDGISFDDRAAAVSAEVAPGVEAASDVKLGHRVVVDYQVSGVAAKVHVDAALAGPVGAVVAADQFTMLGQAVTVNAIGSAGPITQFGGGYTSAADVRASDAVEVHGLLVHRNASYVIQATRVDKLAAAPAYLRVTGLVANLATGTAAGFTLGSLTVDAATAAVLPTGAVLANGQTVTLLALPASLTLPGTGGARLAAAQIRVREFGGAGLDDYVSGSVSQLDPVAKSFVLGSLVVNYTSATVTPLAPALANGLYVQVRGMVGTNGVLAATAVSIRDAGSDAEAELKGNILGYVAASKTFSVRGVAVDASRALITGCPATGLAEGLFVEIEGAVATTGVLATKVQCEDEPTGGTVEREGTAGTVDLVGKTFVLSRQTTVVTVRWTDTTYFGRITPQTLTGRPVHVIGSLLNGVLVATKVTNDE